MPLYDAIKNQLKLDDLQPIESEWVRDQLQMKLEILSDLGEFHLNKSEIICAEISLNFKRNMKPIAQTKRSTIFISAAIEYFLIKTMIKQ